jgi:hypothetical protein
VAAVTFETIVEVGFGGASTSDYLHLDDEVRGLLDVATLGPVDGVWTQLPDASVRRVHIQRGATRIDPVIRYEAGTAAVELNNQDRRFDPTNLSGPYVAAGTTQVTPMRAVRISAVGGGIRRQLWRGFTDEWKIRYEELTSYAEMLGTDATKVLANNVRTAVAGVGAGEDTGARIDRILDSANWSATDRNIFPGDTTLQATTLEGNVWTELLIAQDTEFGELYIDQLGSVQFRNRHSVMTRQRSISAQACFGDNPVAPGTVETGINLATNPSLETDLANWTGGGFANPPTVTRSSAQARFGTWSALATWATASGGDLPQVQYEATGLSAGVTYTASCYAYVPTGSPGVAMFSPTGAQWGTGTLSAFDTWVRLEWTGQAAGDTLLIQFWPYGAVTTAGQEVYLDGMMIEEGSAASTTYVDGDQASSEWDGTAHASASRRLPELPYHDVEIVYDDTLIANKVTITRAGGTAQTVEDLTSQATYLIRTYTRDDLIMQTNAAALEYAEFLLYQTKDPELRFATLTLKPLRDEFALWPQVLARRIGDRIRIIRRPPGGGTITRECFIRGIEHDITMDGPDWVTKWTLQSATKFAYFVLDHNALGVLDENALGF